MTKKLFLLMFTTLVLLVYPASSFGEEDSPELFTDSGTVSMDTGTTSPIYSPDSNHFVYTMIKNEKTVVIIDGKELPATYEEIDTSFFGVLNSGLIYLKAKSNDKWFYTIGGYKSELYDEVNISFYGDNYNIISGIARIGEKWYIIHNKTIIGAYEYVDSYPSYTDDNKKFIYKVTKNSKSTLVINGKEFNLGYDLENFYLSPDGKKLALVVIDNDGSKFVILGQKRFKSYSSIDSIIFSPDSKQLLYVGVGEDGKGTIVSNGEDHKTYDSIGSINFTTSGNHIYYTVTQNVGEGTKQFVVLDGNIHSIYDEIDYPYYSQDEKYFTYFAKNGDKRVLVVNGREVQP